MAKVICGVYKIENKINGKVYVGQSTNVYRRFSEHKYKAENSRIPLDVAIKKYGFENFSFCVLEECDKDSLNEKESFWIGYFQSDVFGYNCNKGGDFQSLGEDNGRSKLTDEVVREIRLAYRNCERSRDAYDRIAKGIISYPYFLSVWEGHFWTHVMPEVYTKENREYYMKKTSQGEKSAFSKMTDDEVLVCRKRYVFETAKEIYEDVKPDVKFSSFQCILWGRYYSHLPVYDNKKNVWK